MSRCARRNGIDKFTLPLAAALIVVSGLAAAASAQVPDPAPAVSPYTLTPERIAASAAALVGLIGAVVGWLALARSRRIA
jgi:Family of unknown function (DUF6223)